MFFEVGASERSRTLAENLTSGVECVPIEPPLSGLITFLDILTDCAIGRVVRLHVRPIRLPALARGTRSALSGEVTKAL